MEQLTSAHILLHALKHHHRTMADFIAHHRGRSLINSLPFIKTLGASQFDLYTGQLSVDAIKTEVADLLIRAERSTRAAYQDWIADNEGYRTITLSDGSDWTLRFIDKPDFIHIHPSRYSMHTIRIKANAMKSVFCYLLTEEMTPLVNVTKLNQLRTQYLQLSPVSAENNEEIRKVYRLLAYGME